MKIERLAHKISIIYLGSAAAELKDDRILNTKAHLVGLRSLDDAKWKFSFHCIMFALTRVMKLR